MRETVTARLENDFIVAEAAGKTWRLHKPGNLEELWERLGEEELDHIPYWTELWPSSLVLAQWLVSQKKRFKDALCLDLGCGMGFTAILGQWLGASMCAADYEYSAVKCGYANTWANKATQPAWIVMDWNFPAFKPKAFKCIWGADIAYEARFCTPMLSCVDYLLKKNGFFWLAEPGRSIFQTFPEQARIQGWTCQPVYRGAASDLHNPEISVAVTVWEFRRKTEQQKRQT